MLGDNKGESVIFALCIVGLCASVWLAAPVSATESTLGMSTVEGDFAAQSDSAEFTIDSATSETDVVQGRSYNAEMTVTNTGDETGTRTLTYDVGSIHRETEMTLDPGETDTWYLTVDSDPLPVGDHMQYFETPSQTIDMDITVKGGEPEFIIANLRAENDGESVSRIEKGETGEVRYAIINDGEGSGEQGVNCYLAGENIGDQVLDLEPSESEDGLSCSFDTSDLSPGTYEYGVETYDDSWYKEIYIEKPPQPPTITAAYPSGNVRLNIATDDAEEFSVEVSDPDSSFGSLSTEWFIDGESYGTASRFTVYAEDLSPGTHTLEAVVSDNQPETGTASREWTIEIVAPPRINDQAPQAESLSIEPSESESFDVTVVDGDTPTSDLDIRWSVDGERAGSGSSFELDGERLSTGQHRVSVTVSDGSSLTEDAYAEWTVYALARPTIRGIAPDRSTVTPGKPVSFSVDASDPNGEGIEDIRWQIAGKQFSGRTVQHTFTQVGTFEATVRVRNEAGLTTTESVEITAEATPPNLERAGPQQSVVDIGEPVELTAQASDPNGRSLAFDYQWRSDTGTTDDQQSTTMRFDEVGQHEITLTVSNKYGAETSRTYTVRVRNDRPSIARRNPSDQGVSVISQRATRFAALVTNRDASPATVRFQVDGSTLKSRELKSDERLISIQHTFETPGDKTVALSVRDRHGAENQITWDLNVKSRPPEFRDVSPAEGRISLMSGETRTFRVAAEDPEGENVELRWFQNGSTIGTGPSVTRTFNESGTYDLRVEATDPRGSTSSRSWSVDVRSFRELPTKSTHLTNIRIDPQSERVTKTFLTVSMENPESNSRTVVVEFIINTPDGLDVVRQRGVDAANNAQITGIAQIEPGSQRSMRVGLRIADESLIGSDVPIDLTIRYHPEGKPEDLTYIRQSSEEVSIQRPGIVSRITSWIDSVLEDLL